VEGTHTGGGLAPEEAAPPIDVVFALVVASAQRAAGPAGHTPLPQTGPQPVASLL
jgi:hypothetical protein